MATCPDNLFYTKSHEWVREEKDGTATIGVTDHAQEAMGDMVFVDLPKVGAKLKERGECGVLESVKSASDFYSPIAGEVVEVNEKLSSSPDLVNKEPYGKGWIARIKPDNKDAAKKLLSADAYTKIADEA